MTCLIILHPIWKCWCSKNRLQRGRNQSFCKSHVSGWEANKRNEYKNRNQSGHSRSKCEMCKLLVCLLTSHLTTLNYEHASVVAEKCTQQNENRSQINTRFRHDIGHGECTCSHARSYQAKNRAWKTARLYVYHGRDTWDHRSGLTTHEWTKFIFVLLERLHLSQLVLLNRRFLFVVTLFRNIRQSFLIIFQFHIKWSQILTSLKMW